MANGDCGQVCSAYPDRVGYALKGEGEGGRGDDGGEGRGGGDSSPANGQTVYRTIGGSSQLPRSAAVWVLGAELIERDLD